MKFDFVLIFKKKYYSEDFIFVCNGSNSNWTVPESMISIEKKSVFGTKKNKLLFLLIFYKPRFV